MSPLELMKFVQVHVPATDQLHALAAMADAPAEDYVPLSPLPAQNVLPSFKLGDGGLGSILSGQNYGVPAPIFGEKDSSPPSIGQLLVGEINE